MKSISGEDAMKIIEMTMKDLDYDIKLVIKQRQGLRGLTPILRESLLWVKCLLNSTACYREVIQERKDQSMQKILLFSYFKISF